MSDMSNYNPLTYLMVELRFPISSVPFRFDAFGPCLCIMSYVTADFFFSLTPFGDGDFGIERYHHLICCLDV